MTIEEICTASANLIGVVLIAIVCLGLYRYKNLDALHKNILVYLFLMMLLDIASRNILISGNNFIVLLVYSLVELVFFVYFYSRFMLNKPNKIIIGLGAVAAAYIVAEIVQYFANPMYIKQFQPYAKVADNFVIIIMALAFFYQKMRSFNETRWGNFKLNTVLLIFFTLNTIIFLPFNFLVNDSSGVVFYIWTANGLAISFFYLYLFSLILKNGKAVLAYS